MPCIQCVIVSSDTFAWFQKSPRKLATTLCSNQWSQIVPNVCSASKVDGDTREEFDPPVFFLPDLYQRLGFYSRLNCMSAEKFTPPAFIFSIVSRPICQWSGFGLLFPVVSVNRMDGKKRNLKEFQVSKVHDMQGDSVRGEFVLYYDRENLIIE